ncbi:MAG TPA: hypothetical protein VIX73_26465, partial [Kofleriaceae bacterium]
MTINEPYFQGHCPRLPVMPGVLQIEAMAQSGGILAWAERQAPVASAIALAALARVLGGRSAAGILTSTSMASLLGEDFDFCTNTGHIVRNTDNKFAPRIGPSFDTDAALW